MFSHRAFMFKKIITICLGITVLFAGVFAPAQFAEAAAKKHNVINVAVMLEATNKARAGKSPLAINDALTRAAQNKADDMVKRGYFAHTTPYGKSPWEWVKEAGYDYENAGENLAVNFDTAQGVVKGWINSPSHKKNLMSDTYTEVGIGIAIGEYEDTKKAVYVVEFYGQPKKNILVKMYGLFPIKL